MSVLSRVLNHSTRHLSCIVAFFEMFSSTKLNIEYSMNYPSTRPFKLNVNILSSLILQKVKSE